MIVLENARVVTPDGVVEPGVVAVEDDTITHVGQLNGTGAGNPGDSAESVDLGGGWLLPGFIDLHVHGGGGHDVTRSPADLAAAVAFHQRRGTTRTLVSLVTASYPQLVRRLGWIAAAADASCSGVLGAHLEGPFLSSVRCGAQNPAFVRDPDREGFARLADAAQGHLRTVTVAPERPGALALIRDVLDAGSVAAIGHSDAGYAEASAAIDVGASLATHLFNGMRPLHHREPGIIGAALNARLACEVINDGVHVHPSIPALVDRAATLVLVTDAIDAAGVGDGDFDLGGQQVQVRSGQARLVSNGSLAGSTLTMDVAVRRAVQDSGLPIEVASAAASGNPARVLGVDHRYGRIAVGLSADLVVLDAELRLQRVMIAGRWCDTVADVAAS